MVATRGRTFKKPWRRSCLTSKLKSSSAPIRRKDSWCFHAVGSSNAPLLGSTAAEGLPRIGRTSIATRWRSCALPQSASCSENFVIPPDVFGQTLREGKNSPSPHVKNAFACTNCHADMLSYARHTVAQVTFPSGITLDSGHNDSNLCMTCHQGRESTASVNKAIAGLDPDTPDPKLAFLHVHYFPAGATRFGTDAKVAYEYAGKSYAGPFGHVPGANTCTGCHEPHGGAVAVAKCGGCHQGIQAVVDLPNIRMSSRGDFDGNGAEDGIAREVARLHRELYAAIQQYARTVGGVSIAFTPEAFPYWHTDTNGNGRIDPEELRPDNRYSAYTPRLMQAVFNYTLVLRDPGAAYHNGRYTVQLLYDSLESLAASGKAGVNMGGKVRP